MKEEWIEKILTILNQRRSTPRQVLVCIFGSFHQREEVHLLLSKHREQCQYSFLLSDKALRYGGADYWKDVGEFVTGEDLLNKQLLSMFDLILIPFLTRNSLAKLAAGIADTDQLTVIQQLFLMGKELIVSDHSYKLTTEHAHYRDLNQNEYYGRFIQEQEQMLKNFGVQICSLSDFKTIFSQEIAVDSTQKSVMVVEKASHKLLTLQDVKTNPTASFNSSTRMTDLAREFLQERNKENQNDRI